MAQFRLFLAVTDVLGLENGDVLGLETGAQILGLENTAETDMTSFLQFDTVTLRLNTFDFGLDTPPPGAVNPGAAVRTQNPTWTGTIGAAESYVGPNPLDVFWAVTATNSRALPDDTAPFDLSDVAVDATSEYLLEDGSGPYLLEDGTDFAPGSYLIEGALAYNYGHPSVRVQTNASGPNTTFGKATVNDPGLRPGNVFRFTNALLGYVAAAFQITQAVVTFPKAKDRPFYELEFGDTPETLAEWTQITAPAAPAAVSAPTVVPGTVTIYGNVSTGHKLWPQGGGVVTILSSAFTVSAALGHSLTVQLVGQIDCRAYAWDNYIAVPRRAVRGVISGGIYTGAWQETPGGTSTTAGARGVYDLSSAPGISLPDGTYTISVQIDTQEYNQLEVFSAFVQAAVTTV